MKKTITIGVTGGIAAFKTLDIVKNLAAAGYNVEVIESLSATNIVSPSDFTRITGNKTHTDLFEKNFDYRQVLHDRRVDHIDLANNSTLLVIVPATANVIAKLAHGLADDFITTTALAATCPILIYPSMNVYMWTNPATQENIQTIRSRGMIVVDPDSGMLACGYEGKGKLADPAIIAREIERLAERAGDLRGKTVLVTAGATADSIDDVRVITNRSSGKMGAAISDACFLRGANVVLLKANSAVSPRYHHKEHLFESPDDLEELVKTHAPKADICFHSAAVSDFTVRAPLTGKASSDKRLPLELTPRTKILGKIKTFNPDIFLVAFKAEWNVSRKNLEKAAREKIRLAHADVVIANDVGRPGQGFATDTNEVLCVTASGKTQIFPLAPKREIAEKIVNLIVTQMT